MENLSDLHNELMNEKQSLEKRLKEIQEELTSISKVLQLIEERKIKKNNRQTSLIPEEKSTEYANMTFKSATLNLLAKHPDKKWEPKQIAGTLLRNGFDTKAAKFGNIARAMLLNFRKDGLVNAEMTKKGNLNMWVYWHKAQETEHEFIRRRFPVTTAENNQ